MPSRSENQNLSELLDTAVRAATDFFARFARTVFLISVRPIFFVGNQSRLQKARTILPPLSLLFISSYVFSAALLVSASGLKNYFWQSDRGILVTALFAQTEVHNYLINPASNFDLVTLLLCGAPVIICIDVISRLGAKALSRIGIRHSPATTREIITYALASHAVLFGTSILAPSFAEMAFSEGSPEVAVETGVLARIALYLSSLIGPLIILGTLVLSRSAQPRASIEQIGQTIGRALAIVAMILPLIGVVHLSGTTINKAHKAWLKEDYEAIHVDGPHFVLPSRREVSAASDGSVEDSLNAISGRFFIANRTDTSMIISDEHPVFNLNADGVDYRHWITLIRRSGQDCQEEFIEVPAFSSVLLEFAAVEDTRPLVDGLTGETIFKDLIPPLGLHTPGEFLEVEYELHLVTEGSGPGITITGEDYPFQGLAAGEVEAIQDLRDAVMQCRDDRFSRPYSRVLSPQTAQ